MPRICVRDCTIQTFLFFFLGQISAESAPRSYEAVIEKMSSCTVKHKPKRLS